MTSFFSEAESARRYAAYRPKVHGIVLDWLSAAGLERVERALDVACGTGDSTEPLREISSEVIGIDTSAAMLAHARKRGLDARQLDYESAGELGQFDLITTCMAFHWFDAPTAVAAFKKASRDGALWLVYNFYFAGHARNEDFNAWMRDGYLVDFPSPPRNKTADVLPADDPVLARIESTRGIVEVEFTAQSLVDYLSTQTNVEEAVRSGRSYEGICRQLLDEVGSFDLAGPFNYGYTYELYRYQGTE
jgi:SAM-dependent methyltransferase